MIFSLPDAIASLPEDGAIAVLPGLGDGRFGRGVRVAVGTAPTSLVVHDLDADGWLDVTVIDLAEHAIHVLRNRGAGVCGGDFDRTAN